MKYYLEKLYKKYNRREYVHPDPLEFLYNYKDLKDREISGLVASTLAFGGVAQILRSVSLILEKMGPSPREYLEGASAKSLEKDFAGFKHRWTTGKDIALLLMGAKKTIKKYGSLQECFEAYLDGNDHTILGALDSFTEELRKGCDGMRKGLLPSPSQGSACKRLNLFLRWMVRTDDVDPGGWHDIPASKLIAPVDTHMFRICGTFGLTERKQADLKTAVEITEAFRKICPEDPVRYDFALTRLGIRDDADMDEFIKECRVAGADWND